MEIPTSQRINSIDILKGIVMVLMALDHVREFFHFSYFYFDPLDEKASTLPIFLTAWITHFCAPAFSFLAGTSAYLSGRKKTKSQLSKFLFYRGIWLIFICLIVENLAWFMDIQFRAFAWTVIWSLGFSMIFLAAMVHLKRIYVLTISLIIIFGHNLLDPIHFEGKSILWAFIHQSNVFIFPDGVILVAGWPVIPWIAVMSLGYCFGTFYNSSYDSNKRRKLFNTVGIISLLTFVVLRYSNLYGDPMPWQHFETSTQTFLSFINVWKYPPSLLYLLLTIGVALIALANLENLKGRIMVFFRTFGRVPFLYYVIHLFLIHILALIFAEITGYGWEKMTTADWLMKPETLHGYGVRLSLVYLIWIGIIATTYPLCQKFEKYKIANKRKWWLGYL